MSKSGFYKNVTILVILILLVSISSVKSQKVKPASFSFFGDYGRGYHYGNFIDKEKEFVEISRFKLLYNGPNNSLDSTDLKYEFRSFNIKLNLNYHFRKNWSLGIAYQQEIVKQTSLLTDNSTEIEGLDLYSLNLIGPQISYWVKSRFVTFSFSTSFLFTSGELYRIPTFYKFRNLFDTDMRRFISAFHNKIELSGQTIEIDIGGNYIFKFGLVARASIRYNFTNVSLKNDPFNYFRSASIRNLFLNFGIGFITRT